jgi:hypothetical protein
MPRIAFSPKAIKSRIDDFVVAQNRAKRILSTAMHNQRLRIQQLEQYQRDLLADEREHAEQLRREAAAQQVSDPNAEVLTDFEGQTEGYQTAQSTAKSRILLIGKGTDLIRSKLDAAETTFIAWEVKCHVTGTDGKWKDVVDKEHGETSWYTYRHQRLYYLNSER